jgi:hypothetical protein
MAGAVHRQHDIEPVKLDIAKMTLVNMPPDDDCTLASAWGAQKNTRTGRLTIAGFEVSSRELPFVCHDCLLVFELLMGTI